MLVIEGADRVGGALRTEELTLPGFRHDVGATVLALAAASPAFRALGVPDALWARPPVPLAHPLDERSSAAAPRHRRHRGGPGARCTSMASRSIAASGPT